ncbi:MAG: hypothetical protein DRP66_00370 [Planctomycetota bacterium]|nr:MAG: hypothetical protein DRP66_00370 [Planctomycetota bacterium]
MEKFKHNKTLFAAVLLFILATSVYAVSPPAKARSPRVLLQKAIYAETTEGDLDKAIELYQQTIDRAGRIQRIAAQATYQLGMCYLKKGEKKKAAEYLGLVTNYPTQKAIVAKAKQQLKELKPEKVVSIFEEISPQVIGHLAERYSKLATEANRISLPCNARIYYVDVDMRVYSGGLSYYYNRDGRSQTGKVHLGGTTYPDQTLYDTLGNKLNVEIVPEKRKENYYHIYWIPDEPLSPGEALYYGWSRNNTRKLSAIGGADKSLLVMQNQYGPNVMETFFLVLPSDLYIPGDYDGIAIWEVDDYSVYSWTQQVDANANHLVNVVIQKRPPLSEEITSLIKRLNDPDAPRFVALEKLVRIGKPAVEPLIAAMEKSNDWQIPKALGAIKDKRAIGPLIEKWEKADFSPMKEVIDEALVAIAGRKAHDIKGWAQWWRTDGQYYTPADTIQNFMAAAMDMNAIRAMHFVAPASHDYDDIKKIFETADHPFNAMLRKIDPAVPIEIIEAKELGKMCTAVWRITFKEDFTIEGKTFKKGETFDLDGGLRKYENRWLITGI